MLANEHNTITTGLHNHAKISIISNESCILKSSWTHFLSETIVFPIEDMVINHRKTNKIINGINSILLPQFLGPYAVTLSWLDGTLEWNRVCFYHNEKSRCLHWSGFSLQGFLHATFNYATPQSTCQSHLTAWWTILCFMTVSCNVILHTYSIKFLTCQTVYLQVKGDNDSRDNADNAVECHHLELPWMQKNADDSLFKDSSSHLENAQPKAVK